MMNYAFLLPIMVLGFGFLGTGYFKEQGEKAFPFKEGDFLKVDNANGKIEVEKCTGKELKVQFEKHIRGYSQKKAEEILGRIKIEFKQEENGVRIKARLPHIIRGDIGVDFHIFVPTKGEFTFDAANGDIKITGIEGEMDIDAANGKISTEKSEGKFDISTANGTITLEDTRGEIDVSATNGKIDYILSTPCDTNKINFTCVNGIINILLPEDVSPTIYASAKNGKVSSDFPVFTDKDKVKGAFQVFATALNGYIRIKRRK